MEPPAEDSPSVQAMASDVTSVVRSSELVPESVGNTVTAPCPIDSDEAHLQWLNKWHKTEFLAEVPPGDRVKAVHGPMGMPWFSVERIKQYKPGFDYTNTIDVRGRIQDVPARLELYRRGVSRPEYLDIATCTFVKTYDIIEWHGFMPLCCTAPGPPARGFPSPAVFPITLIEGEKGRVLLHAMRTLQRAIRRRRVCKNLGRSMLVSRAFRDLLQTPGLQRKLLELVRPCLYNICFSKQQWEEYAVCNFVFDPLYGGLMSEKHREENSQRRYLAILQLMKDEEAEESTTEKEPSDFEDLDPVAQERIYAKIDDQRARRRQRFHQYAAQYDSSTNW